MIQRGTRRPALRFVDRLDRRQRSVSRERPVQPPVQPTAPRARSPSATSNGGDREAPAQPYSRRQRQRWSRQNREGGAQLTPRAEVALPRAKSASSAPPAGQQGDRDKGRGRTSNRDDRGGDSSARTRTVSADGGKGQGNQTGGEGKTRKGTGKGKAKGRRDKGRRKGNGR